MNFFAGEERKGSGQSDSEFLSRVSRGMNGMVVNQIRWENRRRALLSYHLLLSVPLPWNLPKPWVRYQKLSTKGVSPERLAVLAPSCPTISFTWLNSKSSTHPRTQSHLCKLPTMDNPHPPVSQVLPPHTQCHDRPTPRQGHSGSRFTSPSRKTSLQTTSIYHNTISCRMGK